MTNEKLYEDEIERIKKNTNRSPAVRDGKPVPCPDISCVDCDLYTGLGCYCNDAYEAWLKSEAEPCRKGK